MLSVCNSAGPGSRLLWSEMRVETRGQKWLFWDVVALLRLFRVLAPL